MKEQILKKTLKKIEKLQEEVKTVQDYRPANQAQLSLAQKHADKMGVTIAGEVTVDGAGWVIVQYLENDDETGQFRIDPNEWQAYEASFSQDEEEMRALETEETEEKDNGQLTEAKFKKDDIVIPNMGPMKGQRHRVIHVFPNGDVNIQPLGPAKNNRYRHGAAKATPNQLQLVKEEAESGKKFKAIIDGIGTIYVDGKSVGDVKALLRKRLKKPDDILSVKLIQPAEYKKALRDRVAGKEEVEEETELAEATTIPSNVFVVQAQTEFNNSPMALYPYETTYWLKKNGKTSRSIFWVNTPERGDIEKDIEAALNKVFAKWDKFWQKKANEKRKAQEILKKSSARGKIKI